MEGQIAIPWAYGASGLIAFGMARQRELCRCSGLPLSQFIGIIPFLPDALSVLKETKCFMGILYRN